MVSFVGATPSIEAETMPQHASLMEHVKENVRRHNERAKAARAAAAVPGELPDYIKKAWGVTPTPLTDSLSAVMSLFFSVLELRLTAGDGFIASMARARSGMRGDIWNTANIVPRPRAKKLGTLNFAALAAAAVDPMTPNSFSDGTIPEINLSTYVTRFFELEPVQARLSPAVYILALIYLDRAFQRNSMLFLNSFNAHRMVLAAFVCAVKYHEDEYVAQYVLANNGGVSLDELNYLEVEFMKAIDYRLFVTHHEFAQAEIDLMMECIESNPNSRIITVMKMDDIYGIEVALNLAGFSRGKTWDQNDKNLLVKQNTKALLGQMFPGMPVDSSTRNPTLKQWSLWSALANQMTREQHQIYQNLLNIVIELEEAERPSAREMYNQQHYMINMDALNGPGMSFVTSCSVSVGHRVQTCHETTRTIQKWPKVVNGRSIAPIEPVANYSGHGHIGGHLKNGQHKYGTYDSGNLDVRIELGDKQPYVITQDLDPWGNRRTQHQATDHSTSIAKSAVSFILNDNDTFADVPALQQPNGLYNNNYTHSQYRRTAPAQECSIPSLHMQW